MKNVIKIMEKIDTVIYQIQKIIFFIVVAAIIVIDMAQILGRYIFSYSIPWSDQVSLLIFCIIIMLGGNIAIKENCEIKVELIRFKSRKSQLVFNLIGNIISIVTLVLFVISTCLLIRQASTFTKVVQSIQLDYKYVYMIVLAGFLLMLYDKIIMMLKEIEELGQKVGGESK